MKLDSPARTRFQALLARPALLLDEASLAVAAEEYPDLDAPSYLARLDALGALVRSRTGAARGAAATLRALCDVLFGEVGFRGNSEAYYDPRNSFLNEVLDRRLGIPISLSVVLLEVARRAGLALHGVGFPGHFLVKLRPDEGPEIFVDAFNGGELLSRDDLARLAPRGQGVKLDPRWLEAVSSREIVARMLRNLKGVYLKEGDDVRAYWVIDRLLLLGPDSAGELRDRGLVSARLGFRTAARRDLTAYLEEAPTAADAGQIRDLLATLRSAPSLLN